MLSVLQSVFRFELRLIEWAFLAGLLAVPYLAAGVVWAAANTDRFVGQSGVQIAVSILAGIVSWPVQLVFSTGCGP